MRVGIIGTGWGARVQLPAFRDEGLDVRAIHGRDFEKTRSIAGEAGIEAHPSWQEVIERADIDLVSIVTPPMQHAEIAIAALRAGKHVLCEKPTAIDAAEAEAMVAEANNHAGQLALIDHELRLLPTWLAAREMVRDLGGVRLVEVRFCSPSRGDRARPWTWWFDAAAGGGVLGAVGSHFIDAVRYLVGEITAVRASLDTVIEERPFDGDRRTVTADDFATLDLRTLGGARAVMSLSVVSSADEPTVLTIHGERGGVRLVGKELWRSDGKNFALVQREATADRPGDSPGGPFGTGTLYLARALAASRADRTALNAAATFEDGLDQQRALDAARRSSRDGGRWVSLGTE